MSNEELLSVAEIVERLVARFHKQLADHEAKMAEHRASFGARTEADAKIIAGLREESAKYKAERDDLYQREGIEKKRRMDVEDERNALRAEVAELKRNVARFHKQADDHEAKMAEHRAAFGARTEADAKIIAGLREELDRVRNSLGIQAAKEANKVLGMVEGEGLRGAAERVVKERDGLLTQVQDMRAERERLRSENQIMRNDAEDGYAEAIKVLGDPIALSKERDALRAEVAALQERLRASIARGDFAQMEVAALMSQTSKPCDQPVTVKREPEVGDMVQLVRVPTMEEYADWEDLFGGVGSLGIVKSLAHQVANVKYNDFTWEWPLSCIEVVTEATHDTEAGKAAAQNAEKTEQVADEIKVGDVVEVFQSTASCTFKTDIGTRGTVLQLDDSCVDTAPLDGFFGP